MGLARELGISPTDLEQWSSADIGLMKALYFIENKEAEEHEKRAELRSTVDRGIDNVRGQMRGHSR